MTRILLAGLMVWVVGGVALVAGSSHRLGWYELSELAAILVAIPGVALVAVLSRGEAKEYRPP